MNNKRYQFAKKVWVLLAIALVAPISCDCNGDKARNLLEGNDKVLALVANQPISKYDVDKAIYRNYGRLALEEFGTKDRKNVLDSLVQSRAIALVREKELSLRERAALKKRVQAFRESLLVKQYLAKYAPAEPVTDAMMKEYYNNNLERFGGKTIRIYEMLATSRSLAASERKNLLEKLSNPEKQADWRAWANQLKSQNLPVEYRRGQFAENLFSPRITKLIQTLKKGQGSTPTFVEGRAYVVRIADEQQKQAKPLDKVRGQIEKILKPKQLSQSIKKVSEKILEQTEVEYR